MTICPVHAISMTDITACPQVDYDTCIGCGKCIAVCPGLAIFLIKTIDSKAQITMQYEFLPSPKRGETISVLNRKGEVLTHGIVLRAVKKQNKTILVTIEVDKRFAMDARNIKVNSP